MKVVYVALVENSLFGGIMPEVFSTKEAAEFCCPSAEIEECVIDELVMDLDPGDTAKLAKLQEKSSTNS